MIVLRGILLILKWIGILLLVILGLVLLVLLLALLAPVRYKGKVKKQEVPEHAISADGLVSWLNPLIRIRILFSEKKLRYTVRLLGICLLDSEKPKKEKKAKKSKKAKKAKKAKKDSEKKAASSTAAPEEGKLPAPKTEERPEVEKPAAPRDEQPQLDTVQALEESTVEGAEGKPKKSFFEKIKALIEKIKTIPKKIKEKLRRIRKQLELLGKKKEAAVAFLQDEQHMQAVGKGLKTVKELLIHVLPRKLKGHVEFGTGDPESTGKALAVFGILYAVHGKHLTIVPDFKEKRVVADVSFRGRICLGTLLVKVLRFILDKQAKAFYKDWKKFVAVLKQKAE